MLLFLEYIATTGRISADVEGRRKKEEGRRKKEEVRRKKEEGRRKKANSIKSMVSANETPADTENVGINLKYLGEKGGLRVSIELY
jgi:hypothetical protein